MYRVKWYVREIIIAPSNCASSRICSNCGYKNKDVNNLALKEWTCPECGTHRDRDINASKNLLKLTYSFGTIGVGTTLRAWVNLAGYCY